MISEVTQARLAELRAEHDRLLADAEDLKSGALKKREQAAVVEAQIEATEMTIAEIAECDAPTAPVLHKVQVEAKALELLRASSMTEEELIKELGVGRKPVHGWVLRSLRGGKVRRNGEERLEIVG